ncbi:MAG TPA: branched-chain amino acid ABC transporter permease [Nocardioidaceae bacterium]|nr:branched-chain amino acid ABC transporter permease [Nocardioidaceae bacterium]
MDQLLITVLSGVANGAVYGLVGLGLVIIFQSTDVMNFAMAAMATTASYLALSMHNAGLALAVAMVLAVGLASAFGLAVREVLIRPLGDGRLFAALVVTMGVAISTEHFVGQHWGEQPKSFPRLVDGSVAIGGSRINTQDLLIIGVAVVAMAGVAFLFTRTPLGSAMRAVAESSETAAVLGINSQKVARIAWALGVGLATLGVLLYAPNAGLTPVVLAPVLFRAFAGILLGGLTSMTGAVVGGLVIGVLDNLAATYVSASFRDTFVFSIAVLVLLVRPQGMFGRQAFVRV